MDEKYTVKVKICGLKRLKDIQAVNVTKADYAGFLFVKKSIRYCPPEIAVRLRKELAPGIKAVAVFRNESIENALEIIKLVEPDLIQLHGDEDDAYIEDIRKLSDGLPIIKAISVKNAADVSAAQKSIADYVLLDSGSGGTGKSFDWGFLKEAKMPYFLAGGLTPENVSLAIRTYHPYAVDVSSGVETAGLKDPQKIKKFVEACRNDGTHYKL